MVVVVDLADDLLRALHGQLLHRGRDRHLRVRHQIDVVADHAGLRHVALDVRLVDEARSRAIGDVEHGHARAVEVALRLPVGADHAGGPLGALLDRRRGQLLVDLREDDKAVALEEEALRLDVGGQAVAGDNVDARRRPALDDDHVASVHRVDVAAVGLDHVGLVNAELLHVGLRVVARPGLGGRGRAGLLRRRGRRALDAAGDIGRAPGVVLIELRLDRPVGGPVEHPVAGLGARALRHERAGRTDGEGGGFASGSSRCGGGHGQDSGEG